MSPYEIRELQTRSEDKIWVEEALTYVRARGQNKTCRWNSFCLFTAIASFVLHNGIDFYLLLSRQETCANLVFLNEFEVFLLLSKQGACEELMEFMWLDLQFLISYSWVEILGHFAIHLI